MPKTTRNDQGMPPVPAGFQMPFYYASLVNCAMYFPVEPGVLKPYLKGKFVKPALFDGRGLVYFNYQLYTAHFPGFMSLVTEIELNIVSYPAAVERHVPALSFREFVTGEDQTKLYGNLRVHVPCDNPQAIKAGVELFGEPKFQTTFNASLPSLNDPTVKSWMFICNDPAAKDPTKDDGSYIFKADADLPGLDPVAGNVSPTTEYGIVGGRLIGARWNILEPHETYFLDPAQAKRVEVSYGTSQHPMKKDMQTLVGDSPCAAVQTFASKPVAIQSRAYYADI
ncbi:MAG TPA: hypothetical protein VFA21_20660 [Pyrinomonadaceae bacterium]|nr:hypothetical protein [Pyrinomonadaceae bacterium]